MSVAPVHDTGEHDTQSSVSQSTQHQVLLVQGMTCSACSSCVENGLLQHKGVLTCSVSLMTTKAAIQYDPKLTHTRDLIATIECLGFDADLDISEMKEEGTKYSSFFLILALALLVCTVGVGVAARYGPFKQALSTELEGGVSLYCALCIAFATPVQWVCGSIFHMDAIGGLRSGNIGMSFLISTGTTASYLYALTSAWRNIRGPAAEQLPRHLLNEQASRACSTSMMLITFVLVGKHLEAMAKRRTSGALASLLARRVQDATLLESFETKGADSASEQSVAIELVQAGDFLKVKQGEAVPADGTVVSATMGNARVNEAMITGEAKSVGKQAGDSLVGGTIVEEGVLVMRVTAVGSDSVLAQIVRLVEEAQLKKPPIQEYADAISQRFAPFVIVSAIATYVVWLNLLLSQIVPIAAFSHMPHLRTAYDIALHFAIATIVVACPCTFGLATPTAVMVGSGVGAQLGVLMKGGDVLERLSKTSVAAFDKTGTLTAGKLGVAGVAFLGNTASKTEQEQEKILAMLSSVERESNHPVAIAICEYVQEQVTDDTRAELVKAFYGQGTRGIVNGAEVIVGNRAWVLDGEVVLAADDEAILERVQREHPNSTTVLAAIGGELVAAIALIDKPHADNAAVVRMLKSMGVDAWMLTGDEMQAANEVAKAAGIASSNVKASMLPAAKAAQVRELQKKGKVVAMVGDGVNDAIALTQADVGIAVAGGNSATDIAIEAAQVVIMRAACRQGAQLGDGLYGVIVAIDLARATMRTIRTNFAFAVCYNVAMLPFAAGVFFLRFRVMLPPAAAGACMAASSLCVMASSLSLKLYSPPALVRSAATAGDRAVAADGAGGEDGGAAVNEGTGLLAGQRGDAGGAGRAANGEGRAGA